MTRQQSEASPEEAIGGSRVSAQWMDLSHGIRLHVEPCEDGWRWRAWEQMTRTGWQALPAPATQDVALRFSTQRRAQCFFQHLALLLLRHTGHGEECELVVDARIDQRRLEVLGAINLIRPLFDRNADEYSNEQLADALLTTCPELTEFWLTRRHIAQALQRLHGER